MGVLAVSSPFAKAASRKVLAFGDSLTAGYRLKPEESYPKQLERLLRAEGVDVDVTNAGVSGDTSGQALRRVDWSLKQGPYRVVVVGIGANDGLRLSSVPAMEKNLRAIVSRFKASGAKVLLLGMKMPLNFDAKYRGDFETVYKRVARDEKVPLVEFMLEGVAADSTLNLEDQIHPNAKGYAIVAKTVAAGLRPLLNP